MGIRAAVLGIGNLLLGDEGVGIHTIRALRERFVFPGGVNIIDGGTMGLDLLPFIEGNDLLLIIDAVDFNAEPGTVRVVEGKDVRTFMDMKFSVHQIGLPDMLFAASLTGVLPGTMCLVGIQPDRIETGLQLSVKVRDNFDSLMDTVKDKLISWGLELKEAKYVPGNTV
jgi:hydrogenase maturation protease